MQYHAEIGSRQDPPRPDQLVLVAANHTIMRVNRCLLPIF
jgi:hypothetical protein